MITLVLVAAAAAAGVIGPGIRHAADPARWPERIELYDRQGRTVRLLDCRYRYHLAGTDPLPGLAANRAFMAIVLAKDGAVEPWDLEAAWPTCEFLKLPDR